MSQIEPQIPQRLRRLRARTWVQLVWERYAPHFALTAALWLAFLAAGLFGVWERFGDPYRAIVLVIAIMGTIWSFWQARREDWPTLSDAERRMERDNDIAHRPLQTLQDRPAGSDDKDERWQAHLRRAERDADRIRRIKPVPAIAPKDRYFLRFILPAIFILGFFSSGVDSLERLRRLFVPGWISGVSMDAAGFEAWLDPPEYTGQPPLFFKGKTDATAPEGSEFVARVSGLKTPPRLTVIEDGKRRRIALTKIGEQSYEARTTLSDDAEAYFRIGGERKNWRMDITPDEMPVVSWDETPDAKAGNKLGFTFSLADDYGVETLGLVFHLKEGPAAETDSLSVPLPGTSLRELSEEPAIIDTTRHPWAGRAVTGWLQATDGKGQITQSEKVDFILTDQIFVKPLAKAAVEMRALYLLSDEEYAPRPKRKRTFTREDLSNRPIYATVNYDQRLGRAPENIQRIGQLTHAITDMPEGYYQDPLVYMAFRQVNRRVNYAYEMEDLAGLDEDLWRLAERAEFGELADAKAAMQAAERDLQEAMARRAPQREIDELFNRYNNAVDRYMEQLRREALEAGRVQQGQGGEGGGGQDMNTAMIEQLMQAIEEANAAGDTRAARRALAQLAELLENMQMQLTTGGGGGGGESGEEMSEEMREALEELADMMGDQRQLEDQTRETERNQTLEQLGREGSGANANPDELAQQQERLLQQLEQLAQGLDEQGALDGPGDEEGEDGAGGGGVQEGDPTGAGGGDGDQRSARESLEAAEEAMRESQEALRRGDLDSAMAAQGDALRALRDLGEEVSRNTAGEGEEDSDQSDPLGRVGAAGGQPDDELVPDERTLQRARDLLEELRRRASEQNRDTEELDYLERLLDRF